jgi:hypothetical protein
VPAIVSRSVQGVDHLRGLHVLELWACCKRTARSEAASPQLFLLLLLLLLTREVNAQQPQAPITLKQWLVGLNIALPHLR